MPSYNYGQYIAQAIDSVLQQADVEVDVIVVDDGSTDGSLELLETYKDRIRIFRQVHGGPGRARNLGIEQARGEFITFLDADDWLLADSLSMRCGYLRHHPECDWVYASWQVADGSGKMIGTSDALFPHPEGCLEGDIFPALIRAYSGINTLTPLFRLKDVVAVGGYRTDLKGYEDYDFLLKMARGRRVGFCRDWAAGVQRIHLSHHSSRPEIRYESEIEILKGYRSDAEAMHLLKAGYRDRLSNLYNYLAHIYSEKGKTLLALKASLHSMMSKPAQRYAYRFTAYILIGRQDKAKAMLKNDVMQMYSRIQQKEEP